MPVLSHSTEPLVCVLAQEKAITCNTNPDVLAQVDTMDKGNKQKLSEKSLTHIINQTKMAAQGRTVKSD